MPIQTAIYRRSSTFAFRLRVPKKLVPLTGCQFLKRTLRTGDPALARLRGARLLRVARELFQEAERRLSMLKKDELEEMILGFYAIERPS